MIKTFREWLESANPLDRLTSYCDWAVKKFKFDGFHIQRGNRLHDGGLVVAFYRSRGNGGANKPEIQEVVSFFNEAGYECTGTSNSIDGVSITIMNV
jgi:hypothetical protein